MIIGDYVRARKTRKQKPNLEQLDARFVPAAMSSGVAAAAATAQMDARGILRHELRVERLIRRRELRLARLEAREARLEARYAAWHHLDGAAAPAASPITPVPVASTFSEVSGTPVNTSPVVSSPVVSSPVVSSPVVSSPVGSQSALGAPTTVAPTVPVSVTSPSSNPTPVTTTTPTSPTTPVSTSEPLPSNVALALDTIYEEYESGTLPTTSSGPGQIQIQGNDVGVMIKVTNPSDFDTVSAEVQALGMQVTGDSPTTDTIAGLLPISELPAVAQLADAPIIVPVYTPIAR
jgi:hypothetical protein